MTRACALCRCDASLDPALVDLIEARIKPAKAQ